MSTAQATAIGLKANAASPVLTGPVTTDPGAIPAASVTGLATALNNIGTVVALFGDIPRNHPVSGAVLPAPPTVTVMWITVGAAGRPAAFNLSGDIWLNEELA